MAAHVSWSYRVSLPPESTSAASSRRFVGRHLDDHGLSHLREDVQLVVSELATNAMVHARTPFTVSLHAFERLLLLEVEDGSPAGPVHVAAQALDTGGRGIAIVTLLCHDWGVDARPAGKSVWAEFEMR